MERIAREILQKRKEFAEMVAEQDLNQALKNPNFASAYNKKRELVFEIAKRDYLKQDVSALKTHLKEQKVFLASELNKMGFSGSEIKPNYTCHICGDTGYTNGKRCDCNKKLISELLLKNSGIATTQLPTFENANFSLFEPAVQTDMQNLYSKMETYTSNLEGTSKKFVSLLGNTGVGKTHLAQCMVQNAILHNYYTVYVTAFQLSNDFLKYHTATLSEKSKIFAKYLMCELLVIDDLGTEPKYNNVTEEYMYLLVNERLTKNKNTVVTSNLSLQQVREVYGERVFSRIASKDKALLLELKNKDLRLKI